MSKQLILHLGLHKTGSTSIQKTCQQNQQLLLQEGILYPLFKAIKKNKFQCNHSVPIVSVFGKNGKSNRAQILMGENRVKARQSYEQQLDKILETKSGHLVISGEGISTLGIAELGNFKAKIESFGWLMRVIVYIRAPISFATSAFAQRIKAGYSFANAFKTMDQSRRGKTIMTVFPNAEFYPFKSACETQFGVVGHFLSLLGISNQSGFNIIHANQRYSNCAVRLVAFINSKYPRIIDGQINEATIGWARKPFSEIEGEKFCFTKGEYEDLKPLIITENNWFRDNLGQDFCDDSIDIAMSDCLWTKDAIDSFERIINRLPLHILRVANQYFRNEAQLNTTQQHRINIMFKKAIHRTILKGHVEELIKTAIQMEKVNLQIALQIMELAHYGRPNGHGIINKLAKYKSRTTNVDDQPFANRLQIIKSLKSNIPMFKNIESSFEEHNIEKPKSLNKLLTLVELSQ